uniref:(northern house mosquito) hypothetical protein n=2 Tax=Culex pipiens TaxID=7175 RepID=A0A8D8DRQ3_CULPI
MVVRPQAGRENQIPRTGQRGQGGPLQSTSRVEMVLQGSSQVILLRKGRPRPNGLVRWQRFFRRKEPHHPLGTPTLNPNRPNNPQPTATPLRQHPHHGRTLQHGSPSGGGRSRNRRRHHVRRRAADGHRGRLLVRTAQRPPSPDRRNR